MADHNKNDAMEKDDVEDFLYGSDASGENYGTTSKPATKKSKCSQPLLLKMILTSATLVDTDEDDEIYEQYNEPTADR